MSSSRWTHSVCETCYYGLEPDRNPVRTLAEDRAAGPCCGCGKIQSDGIFYRADPRAMGCGGQHSD